MKWEALERNTVTILLQNACSIDVIQKKIEDARGLSNTTHLQLSKTLPLNWIIFDYEISKRIPDARAFGHNIKKKIQ